MSNLAFSNQEIIPDTQQPSTALTLIETIKPAEVFVAGGLDPILKRIRDEAMSRALDISTAKGRKEIASLAHQIAKSKTAIDKAGKDLVAGIKAQAKVIDAERGRAWDELEKLQTEIRQPLTAWENREKDRIAQHEASLAEIKTCGTFTAANWQSLSVETMNDRLNELLTDKNDWQEFSVRAKQATEEAAAIITAAILKRQTHDAEQAELARLRKEEEERKQREHEERLKTEAAEKARKEAEDKARAEAEAEAKRAAAEKVKAQEERQRIEREKEEAEARARKAEEERQQAVERAARAKVESEARAVQAEKDRIAAEARAKENARMAAAKAEADKRAAEEAAAKRERDRIEAEKKAEADAVAKREADRAHRDKINNQARQAFTAAGLAPHDAKHAIELIAQGHIPHIKIHY